MTVLDELEPRARDLLTRVGPAVVGVGRAGSGIVLADGHVLTNAHNLRSDETTVTLDGGRTATGRVAGADLDGDLAVLAVPTDGAAAPEWADEEVALGRPVVALARSATGQVRMTVGTVSATDQSFRGPGGRRITGGIEHTAPLARGSSGGPILDLSGRLLGLNTNRLADGFYLALPAGAELRARVDALRQGERPRRRRLGIGVAPAAVARRLRASVGLDPRDGVLVRAVAEDSPAERTGLRVGDLVVAAGGRPVADVDALQAAIDAVPEGESLPLEVLRGSDELTMSVTFGPGREEGSA